MEQSFKRIKDHVGMKKKGLLEEALIFELERQFDYGTRETKVPKKMKFLYEKAIKLTSLKKT
jgi:hypothetical protein